MSRNNNKSYRLRDYQLKKITAGIRAGVEKGAAVSLTQIAPKLLENIVEQEARFNNYTGNLEESYVAVVFTKGKKTIFDHNAKDDDKNTVVPTKGGGRKVKVALIRHGERAAGWFEVGSTNRGKRGEHRYERKKEKINAATAFRYLKKWEKEDGYKKMATLGMRRERVNARGLTSYLQIRNVAPYAAAVQYGKRGVHYNVLRGAMIKNMRNEMFQLIKIVTLKELKGQGLNVKAI
jgi:hypothetical protein